MLVHFFSVVHFFLNYRTLRPQDEEGAPPNLTNSRPVKNMTKNLGQIWLRDSNFNTE
jgi:hypothetical protein